MGNDLTLRRWQSADCRTIYDWRQHPDSCRWSLNQQEFSFAGHESWFARILAADSIFCYMLEEKKMPVAQIRLEPAQMPGSYRVSVSVAPEKTGRGFGSMILRLVCQQQELARKVNLLIAETKLANVPSQKIFSRQGFLQISTISNVPDPYLIWILPLALHSAVPVPIQLLAPSAPLGSYEEMLGKTGLALMADRSAPVKVFFNEATCADLDNETIIFHLNENVGGETILDLALGFSPELSLPVSFADSAIAVAQIAAAVKYSTGA